MIGGYSLGAKVTGCAAAVSLGALTYYGFNLGHHSGRAIDRVTFWPLVVKERIAATYSYLFQSLVITAVGAAVALRSPVIMHFMAGGGFISLLASLGCIIGLQYLIQRSPYIPGSGNWSKKALWAVHSLVLGFFIAPLVAMFGDVVAQAALYTAGVAGGISLIGWTAPSREYMAMTMPVAMVAGCLIVAVLASPFFNPLTAGGGALQSFIFWGGMIFSGFYIFYQTQLMLDQAENHPPAYEDEFGIHGDYDPINVSLGLHLALLNILQRFILLLGMNNR